MTRKYRENISKATGSVEKLEKEIEKKDGEIIKLGSDLNRTKLQLAAQEKENDVLKSKHDEVLSELESHRRGAKAFDLKHAELIATLARAKKDAYNFVMKIAAVSLINTKLNIREGTLAAQ